MPNDDKKLARPRQQRLPDPTMWTPREGQVVDIDGQGKRIGVRNEDGIIILTPVTEH